MQNFVKWFIAVNAAVILTACGLKGDLTYPQAQTAQTQPAAKTPAVKP